MQQKISEAFAKSQQEILEKELGKLEKQYELTKKMPDYGDSVDDNAQEEEDFEEGLVLQKNLKNLIKEIKLALKRIENGSYGLCVSCGQKIETGRLKVYPSAAKCVSCSAKKK